MSDLDWQADGAEPNETDAPEIETDQAEDIEATEAESDGAADQPEGDDRPKKETARERRERDKAAKQRLRDERDEAQRKAEAAEERLNRIKEARQSEKPPAETDFDDHYEFIAAKVLWQAERRADDKEATQAATEVEEARRQAAAIRQREEQMLHENFKSQAKSASERYADFEEVILRPGLFPVGHALPTLIQSSEMAADLAYHIASDRALHDSLLPMTPIEIAREIGRIEARLSLPQSRKTTSAPEPITPLRGGASSSTRDPMKMSAAEYNAWREAGGTF